MKVSEMRQLLKEQARATGQSYESVSKQFGDFRASMGRDMTAQEIMSIGSGSKNDSAASSGGSGSVSVSAPATQTRSSTSTTTGALSTGTDSMLDDNGQPDWSKRITQGIANGESVEQIKGYWDQRNQKIDAAGGSLDQYRDDEVSRQAQEYIAAHTPAQSEPAQSTPAQSAGNDPFLTGLDDYGDEDLSVQLRRAIDGNAPPAVVQGILDRRNQKIEEKGYYQYAMDDITVEAMDYIAQKSGQRGGGGGSSGGYDLSGHLEDAAAGRLESDLADLKSAYGKTMDEYDAAADKLPQYYQTAKNQAAAQSAMAQKNFDERAAASGLNSGAGGQAMLDAQATYRGTLAQLDQSQADALTELDRAKAALTAQYQTAVAKARSEGRADLAQALYQEMVRVQGLQRADDAMSYDRYLTELERQRVNEQTSFERGLTDQQFAANQVNAILVSGGMPSNELLAAAGLSQEYAQGLYGQYQRQEAERQKALAQAQVNAILQAGKMPSQELIAASGYAEEYIQAMQDFYKPKQTVSSGGYPGTPRNNMPLDPEDHTEEKQMTSARYNELASQISHINPGVTQTQLKNLQYMIGQALEGGEISVTEHNRLMEKVGGQPVDKIREWVTNQATSDWVRIAGMSRVTWPELKLMVEKGEVMESYDEKTGKYSYRMNPDYNK